MGRRHRGLYTVATRHARHVLTRDEVVAGTWAHIAPPDAPDARLPGAGLLVVHDIGPPSWDAFWPRGPLLPVPELRALFDEGHRPPAQLIGWLHAACYGGHPAVVELLLDAAPGHVDTAGPHRWTPLWPAVGGGSQPVADLLLAAGADPAVEGLAAFADQRGVHLPR